MRGLWSMAGTLALAGGILAGAAVGASAKETKEYDSGQWTGFSYTNNDTGQFTDCTVWAFNRDNVQLGISVLKDWSLEIWLNSDKWNLPAKQTYPVSYWVDRNQTYSGKAAVSGAKFVYIVVESDNDVFQELKAGSQFTVRTKDVDYVFDLSGSKAALTRLLDCVDQYSKASNSNPFGGGEDQGGNQQNDGGAQQNNDQQNGDQQGGQQGGSSASEGTSLKAFTVSPDEVRAFLVDVTGAKPSMISVTPKKNKQGELFYALSTPIGAGEFWQEELGTSKLEDIALGYLDAYKEDCKQDYDQSLNKPVTGPKGDLVTGTATCGNSPYQDSGPEILSYAISAGSDGIVSIYVTYAGGNAAKTKTDALGRLIGRRMAQTVQGE